MDNKNIKYTESAASQIEAFKEEQAKLLEDIIVADKYVLGDDFIEITGNDIQQAKNKLIITKKKSTRRLYSLELLGRLYASLGVIITVVGIYFDDFKRILDNDKDKDKAMIIIMGLTMTLLGFLSYFYAQLRKRKQKEEEEESLNAKIANKTEIYINNVK